MRHKIYQKKRKKKEYKRKKIYGKGLFTGYANLLGKIIKL